ncbi:hypothetical protein HXY33_02780 [Candidatus Bathyarchaeota archaeon]|nr:hypothetical protein [Candidatus Bathyarchaeota archaeon]
MHPKKLRNFLKSKKALTVPVTYLILFVSLLATISVTYSFAIVKISARGALLKVSVAKQNMLVLDSAVHSVAWSFGASEVVYMDDCGGPFKTESTAKDLVINFTDEQSFNSVVFNSSIGKVFYELESSESSNDGLFVKGDYKAIINQSAFTMTQLYFASSNDAEEIVLCYRPSAAALLIGTSNGKPLNVIRIYIVNLNSSQSLNLKETFYLKVTSLNVTTFTQQFNLNSSVSSLALKAVFEDTLSTVWLPVSSNAEGSVVNLEIVVCNVKIQKAEV